MKYASSNLYPSAKHCPPSSLIAILFLYHLFNHTESIASPSDMNSPQVLIALLKNSVKTRWNNRCRSYTLKEKKDVLAQVDEMRKENPSMLITLAMEQLGLPNVYYMLVGRKM